MTSNANLNGNNAHIEVADILYPSVAAMLDSLTALPWFKAYSKETQEALTFAFFAGVHGTYRLIGHRLNTDQTMAVFADLERELLGYDMIEAIAPHAGTVN